MEEFWVFGYGSLMWRPGFAFIERTIGTIYGFRRSLCVFSHVYRGTPDRPGLVLGLDAGGSCHGVGFRVAPEAWQGTLEYLRRREQVTAVYREVEVPVRLVADGRQVRAITYAADRQHPQYAGRQSIPELLRLVRQGTGISGTCAEYVLNTVEHLRELGIHDAELETLASRLKEEAGS